MMVKPGAGFFLADLSSNLLVVFLILFALVTLAVTHAPADKVDVATLSRIKLGSGKDFVDALYAYDSASETNQMVVELSSLTLRSSNSGWQGRAEITGDQTSLCSQLATFAKQNQALTIFVMSEHSLVELLKRRCFADRIPLVLFVPRALKDADQDWSPATLSLMNSRLGPDTFRLHLLKLLEGAPAGRLAAASRLTFVETMRVNVMAILRWGDFILSLLSVIVVLVYIGRKAPHGSVGEY